MNTRIFIVPEQTVSSVEVRNIEGFFRKLVLVEDMDNFSFWKKTLKAHELLEEIDRLDFELPDTIYIFPPDNANNENTDEDSGDEDIVDLDHLPGSQLRAEVELGVRDDVQIAEQEDSDWESDDNLPLATFVTRKSTGENQYYCQKIDYFAQEEYSPDIKDSTLVIPYVVSKAAIFFLLASCMLLAAFACCILGHCVRYRGIYTFISGLLFIFTGLLMLLGLIVYISIFKAEVGSKLRPQSHIRPPLFEYEYGYSFLMYIIGLFSTKLSGVGCVFLFMYRVQYHWKRKEYDEMRNGNRPPSMVNLHKIIDIPMPVEYPCKRHPYYYVNSNSTVTFPRSPARKMYPLPPKQAVHESPCSLHRSRFHQSTPSLKDVSTSFYDFPPPPTISYQFDEHFTNRDRALSRDVTMNTVNTMSTTADVNMDELPEPYFDEYSPSLQNEFVAFDLDEPLPIRAQSIVSISSRGGCRKSCENDTMRRTTPV